MMFSKTVKLKLKLSLMMLFKNKTGSGRKKQRLIGMWMEIGTLTIIIQDKRRFTLFRYLLN
jgi:hypothetical protein